MLRDFKLIAIICLMLLACASSGKVVGTIYIMGNEPFTSVALETPEGKVYRVSTTKELEQRLRGLQGRKVELEFTKIARSPEGQTIVVSVVRDLSQ